MKTWLVLTSPNSPIDVIDAETAEAACIKAAKKRGVPGRYMAVEWNPVILRIKRNRSENWSVSA